MYVLREGKNNIKVFVLFYSLLDQYSVFTNRSYGRYIQGARLSGNSNDAKVDDGVAMDGAEATAAELVVPATSLSMRSRFVGQGYKQVKAKK